MASSITAWRRRGAGCCEFSSIMRASRAWSSEPQFTPIRTGLPRSIAASIMVRKLSSCFLPMFTLPGLIRYFASARAHSGYFFSRMWPL